MNYRCHKIAGAFASSASFYYLYQNQMIPAPSFFTASTPDYVFSFMICLSGGVAGGLFPDIDHPQSTIGRKRKITSYLVNSITGHRGLTHYPVFLLWLSFMIFIGYYSLPLTVSMKKFYFLFCTGFIAGYVSHIFIDLFNKKGIRLLAPFFSHSFSIPVGIRLVHQKGKNKIKFKYLSGGSPSDQITCILCVVIVLTFIILFI